MFEMFFLYTGVTFQISETLKTNLIRHCVNEYRIAGPDYFFFHGKFLLNPANDRLISKTHNEIKIFN